MSAKKMQEIKNKKIAIPLINLSSHGGVRVIIDLADYLSTAGHDVEILVPRNKISTNYKIPVTVKIKECGPVVKNKVFCYLLYLICLPFFLRGKDIIVANFFPTFYPSFIASILFNSKLIYFVQDIETKYQGFTGNILNYACRLTYTKPKIIVAANKFLAKTLSIKYNLHVDNINIGLNEIFFSPINQKFKNYDFIYFLRHEKWKRKELFAEVLFSLKGKLPNIKPICVTQDETLFLWAAEIGVEVIKPKDDKELIDVIDQSKAMLLTSSYEGFGLPPLECMARGVPAVVFECGGPGVYINNKINSFIVNTKEEAVQMLLELIENPELREQISREAQKSAMPFRNSIGFGEFSKINSL